MVEKKTKGRKRHIVVDVLGHLLHVKVHAANIHDTKAACEVFDSASKKYPSIQAYSADAGYCGTGVEHVDNEMKLKLHISKESQIILLFYQSDGLLNEHLRGLEIFDVYQKILKY